MTGTPNAKKLSDSSVGTQKQIGFQTIKPDSARREWGRSLTTAKAISIRG
ncbi:hypothetical protein SAMN03159401_0150 [Klebsiella quasipneumoniae]|nr:hypothetical protein SAMN03159401_0150 [Klebsiella quasipneumoniae]